MSDSDRERSPLPATSISTLCRYCGQEYSKLNVEPFLLIKCPHCQCPDYQGKANRSQHILIDTKYQEFLTEKGESNPGRIGSDVSHNRDETQTGTVFPTLCRYCSQEYSKLNVDYFALIECPHCGCPDYQGKANRSQHILVEFKYENFLVEKGESDRIKTRPVITPNTSDTPLTPINRKTDSISPDSPVDNIETSSNPAILVRINQLEDQVHQLNTENQELKQALQKAQDDHMTLKNQVRQSLKGLYQITTTRLVNLEKQIAELEGNGQSRNRPLKQTALTDGVSAEMTNQTVNDDQYMSLYTPSELDDTSNPFNVDAIPDPFAVEMTEQSVMNCLNNQHKRILFERKRTGRYWIHPIQDAPGEDPIYHLGLKPDECLTQDRLLFVKSCFHVAHEERDSFSFQMIRPAIVKPVNYGDAWELLERGQIERLPSQDTNHA